MRCQICQSPCRSDRYCKSCGRSICHKCIKIGCCGARPAILLEKDAIVTYTRPVNDDDGPDTPQYEMPLHELGENGAG